MVVEVEVEAVNEGSGGWWERIFEERASIHKATGRRRGDCPDKAAQARQDDDKKKKRPQSAARSFFFDSATVTIDSDASRQMSRNSNPLALGSLPRSSSSLFPQCILSTQRSTDACPKSQILKLQAPPGLKLHPTSSPQASLESAATRNRHDGVSSEPTPNLQPFGPTNPGEIFHVAWSPCACADRV